MGCAYMDGITKMEWMGWGNATWTDGQEGGGNNNEWGKWFRHDTFGNIYGKAKSEMRVGL